MSIDTIGIPWYTPEHYQTLRVMFKDGDELPITYDEWLVAAEQARKRLEAEGVTVICVRINPNNLSEFCLANGVDLDKHARHSMVNVAVKHFITGQH